MISKIVLDTALCTFNQMFDVGMCLNLVMIDCKDNNELLEMAP